MELQGKIALVTGSSGDIGAGTALMFAQLGASVAVHYHANRETAQEVALGIEKTGSEALVVQADVVQRKQVEAMIEQIVERFGRIDILVNNAGVRRKRTDHKYILDVTDADWDAELETHLRGTFNCCKAVVPHMIEQGYGRIVSVSSVVARSGSIGASVQYPAAKAGMFGFTKALANQVAKDGITVNVVAPGMIDTSRIRWRTPEQMKKHVGKIPVGRLGKVEEVAAAICFLASEQAGYITGATLDVNGGMYMA